MVCGGKTGLVSSGIVRGCSGWFVVGKQGWLVTGGVRNRVFAKNPVSGG